MLDFVEAGEERDGDEYYNGFFSVADFELESEENEVSGGLCGLGGRKGGGRENVLCIGAWGVNWL